MLRAQIIRDLFQFISQIIDHYLLEWQLLPIELDTMLNNVNIAE